MRRFTRYASVVALVVMGAGATVSADSAERPLAGTVVGQVNFLPAPDCFPVPLKTVSDGVGKFTHLGLTVMHAEHCTPPGDFNPYGEMILTAANGDTLELVYNGFAPFPTPETEVVHVEGDFRIVGGTGRFADATGGQFDMDWTTFNYVADADFPGYLPDGSLPPGPWPAVWVYGPSTIGY